MQPRRSIFNRPSFASLSSPERRHVRKSEPSSPTWLTDSSKSSSIIDLTDEYTTKTPPADTPDPQHEESPIQFAEDENSTAGPNTQHEESPIQSEESLIQSDESPTQLAEDQTPTPTPAKSSQHLPCAAEASQPSLNDSFQGSLRVTRGGQEVVISSDGEESDDSLDEDPLLSLMPKSTVSRPTVVIPVLRPTLPVPGKYNNTIDSLLQDARNDVETERKVAQAKAGFNTQRNNTQEKAGLHEKILTSALEDKDDDDGGMGAQRVIEAVRRTEALDEDMTWRFLNQAQIIPAAFEFPRDLFHPGSSLAALRDTPSRERMLKSGILEFAASRNLLPDELIRWLFCHVPYEPKAELRQAYCRVVTQCPAGQFRSLIKPNDIDDLFLCLGAKPRALDFSQPVDKDPHDQNYRKSALKDRAIMLSIFELLRDAIQLFSEDSLEHAIQILLRMALDTSLTADGMVRSELQSCLTALLEVVPGSDDDSEGMMMHRICKTVYESIQDVQFQSQILQHILPTSKRTALLRYRLAMAFLLQKPGPLTEPVEEVLNLKRLTLFLISDKRLKVKSYKKSGHDYGQLIAVSTLLDIVINSTIYDLNFHTKKDSEKDHNAKKDHSAEKDYNAAIDKIAAQIKGVFSAIEDAGASHLKRMLAKEALERVHYRMLYSVRSKPPPSKRMLFASDTPRRDGNIGELFKPRIAIHTCGLEETRP
ncbi:uncharacterized protein N7483_000051 [Penicillium malachiteum]|uniref:uncharacterized protein n=1 Tax=Penicillium malachiteum TaxID=1324776 RepID=UPI00254806B0|nr:uncharacterized protein N7483_000051 [Penicillium malachiteum]KAJ5734926.1 hypothetical protein N7483_000051 [Penicillium malachiteum]